MKLPAYYTQKKYPLLEIVGLGLVLIQVIIILAEKYGRFDWAKDTIWVAAIVLLTWSEWQKENPIAKLPSQLSNNQVQLLYSLYLTFYHLLATYVLLKFGGIKMLLHLACTVVFGIALYLRSNDSGYIWKNFKWKNLLRFPAWPVSVALFLCFIGMFLPMVKSMRLASYYGMQFGYDAYNGWGYNNWGYNFYTTAMLIKGYYASWGMFICLLLCFLIVFHILKYAGSFAYPKLDLVIKIAVPVLFIWWLAGAKGYQSLKGFGNILFILGFLLLAFAIFLPQKLQEVVKARDLIK